MSLLIAERLVRGLGLYFGIGFVFACLFVSFGVSKIDPAAKGMALKVRLLILPGVMLLWPLMLIKWATQKETQIT